VIGGSIAIVGAGTAAVCQGRHRSL
jgi:hypothetical protein